MGHRPRHGVPGIARRTRYQDSGGRTWWAHVEFTRINIAPTILGKKIEDVREADTGHRRSVSMRTESAAGSSATRIRKPMSSVISGPFTAA
jgi:hypothetical protein